MNIPSTAAVAGPHKNELMLFYTLLELTIIVVAGRVGGTLAKRCGQSAALGEIIVGILLGPSLFGLLAPPCCACRSPVSCCRSSAASRSDFK